MVDNNEIGNSLSDPKRRRSRKSCADYCLPDDVLFNIFMSFPVDVLYNVMRLVCKQWYNLIQSPLFISSHLKKESNTNRLLIHHRGVFGYVVNLWAVHGGRGRTLEEKHLNFRFIKRVSASCNGLLYVIGPIVRTSNCPSYVVNPVTKQYLPLPLFPDALLSYRCHFGYAAASRVYKVMHQSRWLILTVGVDKAWREVDLSHLSDTTKGALRYSYSCRTVRGSVYWILRIGIILRFDMETETFREIDVSSECIYEDSFYGLLPMENSVCLWLRNVDDKQFWLLKDVEKGDGDCESESESEREKLFHISEKGLRRLSWHSIPMGWLRSKDLFIFHSMSGIMVYNVNTGQVHQTKDMKKTLSDTDFMSIDHVDSLVSLNNLLPQLPFKSSDNVYSKQNMRAEFHKFKGKPL